MSKWTKEQRIQKKEEVKAVLLKKPKASKYELARDLSINKETALRLKKEIISENTKFISKQKIEEEIGRLEAEYQELISECWKIIDPDLMRVLMKDEKEIKLEKPISIREKLNAIKTIVDTEKTLFAIKLNAGIFSRKLEKPKLGEKLTQEEKDLIKKAIELNYGVKEQQKH